MIDWINYCDKIVQVSIPRRIKKVGKGLFFRGRMEWQNSRTDIMMAIQADLPPAVADVIRRGIVDPPSPDIMGSICTYHHRGESTLRAGGYEVKLTQTTPEAGSRSHRWAVAFPVATKWVQIDIANGGGGLSWEEFEAICLKIILSFRLVTPEENKR